MQNKLFMQNLLLYYLFMQNKLFVWFDLRTLTTDYQHIQKYICSILLFLTVCDQVRFRFFSLIFF